MIQIENSGAPSGRYREGAAMAALDATAGDSAHPDARAGKAAAAQAAAAVPMAGDPAALGLPSFIAGSVALGLALVGSGGHRAAQRVRPIRYRQAGI